MEALSRFFWSESFWLPNTVRWNDLKSNSTARFPQVEEFKYTIYYGVVMLFVRIFFECCVFLPFGHFFGWSDKSQSLPLKMIQHLNFGFAGKSKFKRVAETAWRFVFYLCAWTAGVFVLWNEPQLSDVNECWRNYPDHPISDKVWWYYIIETAFYWALLFSSVVFDIRRADFYQLTLHHIVTISLLFISWSINMVRVGTLILFSHDVADIFIELGKLFRYANWQTALHILFVIFMFVWCGTRLFYYPFYVIRSVVFDAPELIQKSYRWEEIFSRPIVPRLLMVMLCCLLVLHIFWTYVLVKVAVHSLRHGEMDDIREDASDSDEAAPAAARKNAKKKD